MEAMLWFKSVDELTSIGSLTCSVALYLPFKKEGRVSTSIQLP